LEGGKGGEGEGWERHRTSNICLTGLWRRGGKRRGEKHREGKEDKEKERKRECRHKEVAASSILSLSPYHLYQMERKKKRKESYREQYS